MNARRLVGVTGFAHEANALADVISLAHGDEVSRRPGGLVGSWEAGALIRRLHERGNVEVVDLPVWEFGASGPLPDDDFRTVVAQVELALADAGPLDALVVLGHGAGRTVEDTDPDATFLRAVRSAVGDDVPVVVVLDFHANLSSAMVGLSDVVVAYRTNPHVDIEERLVEAADHVVHLLDHPGTVRAYCSLPMVLPQIALNTTAGEPLHEVMSRADELSAAPLLNISVMGGFSLSDVPDCGLSVCVTADASTADDVADATRRATAACRELAALVWQLRPRYRLAATSLADAVEIAARAAAGTVPPVILADVADNPGGGAPGNSTFVLRALLDAGVRDVVMGLHCDADVVAAAFSAGEGARLRVVFNEGSTRSLAPPLAVDAEVLALTDGPVVPRRGVYAGATRHPGRCCTLQIDGIRVGVSSRKLQCADDDTLRHVGLHPEAARVVVVKSRGHFRAGFAHLFPEESIVEVSAPGVATIDLTSVEWQHLPRPVFPLDEIPTWSARVTSCGRTA